MNESQERWWQQARSDQATLELLRRHGAAPCHQLHYLQMVTEKLGKAYLWRSGRPPRRTHASFVQFLRYLGSVRQSQRRQIADAFSFGRFEDFQNWLRTALPIAYDLERLAPALAQNGPNTEYPWPQEEPEHVPASYEFPLWSQLTDSVRGRQLTQIIKVAVEKFPEYAS